MGWVWKRRRLVLVLGVVITVYHRTFHHHHLTSSLLNTQIMGDTLGTVHVRRKEDSKLRKTMATHKLEQTRGFGVGAASTFHQKGGGGGSTTMKKTGR